MSITHLAPTRIKIRLPPRSWRSHFDAKGNIPRPELPPTYLAAHGSTLDEQAAFIVDALAQYAGLGVAGNPPPPCHGGLASPLHDAFDNGWLAQKSASRKRPLRDTPDQPGSSAHCNGPTAAAPYTAPAPVTVNAAVAARAAPEARALHELPPRKRIKAQQQQQQQQQQADATAANGRHSMPAAAVAQKSDATPAHEVAKAAQPSVQRQPVGHQQQQQRGAVPAPRSATAKGATAKGAASKADGASGLMHMIDEPFHLSTVAAAAPRPPRSHAKKHKAAPAAALGGARQAAQATAMAAASKAGPTTSGKPSVSQELSAGAAANARAPGVQQQQPQRSAAAKASNSNTADEAARSMPASTSQPIANGRHEQASSHIQASGSAAVRPSQHPSKPSVAPQPAPAAATSNPISASRNTLSQPLTATAAAAPSAPSAAPSPPETSLKPSLSGAPATAAAAAAAPGAGAAPLRAPQGLKRKAAGPRPPPADAEAGPPAPALSPAPDDSVSSLPCFGQQAGPAPTPAETAAAALEGLASKRLKVCVRPTENVDRQFVDDMIKHGQLLKKQGDGKHPGSKPPSSVAGLIYQALAAVTFLEAAEYRRRRPELQLPGDVMLRQTAAMLHFALDACGRSTDSGMARAALRLLLERLVGVCSMRHVRYEQQSVSDHMRKLRFIVEDERKQKEMAQQQRAAAVIAATAGATAGAVPTAAATGVATAAAGQRGGAKAYGAAAAVAVQQQQKAAKGAGVGSGGKGTLNKLSPDSNASSQELVPPALTDALRNGGAAGGGGPALSPRLAAMQANVLDTVHTLMLSLRHVSGGASLHSQSLSQFLLREDVQSSADAKHAAVHIGALALDLGAYDMFALIAHAREAVTRIDALNKAWEREQQQRQQVS